MGFEPIGETLDRSLTGGPLRPIILALSVEKAAKPILPSWATVLSFREGRLTLATPSPTHSQELFLQGRELSKKINEGLGGKVIEEIKLKIKV